jgi:hypothetical protein
VKEGSSVKEERVLCEGRKEASKDQVYAWGGGGERDRENRERGKERKRERGEVEED